MKKTKSTKGITLIALVITIIILLILAGVAISQLTENGLFNKTQVAKEKYNIEEEKERLEIEIANLKMQMYMNNNGKEMTLNDLKTYFDGEKFNGEYMVELFYEPLATTEDVSVEPVYAKVTHIPTRFVFYVDGKLVVIGGGTEEAEIDSKAPQAATITLSSTAVDVGSTITATVSQNDKESGIVITNCKYIVNQSSEEIGVDDAAWDSATAFETNPQTISITETEDAKTDYLHVLSVDREGNKRETISSSMRFKGYTALPGSYIINRDQWSWTSDVDAPSGGSASVIYTTAVDLSTAKKIVFNGWVWSNGGDPYIKIGLGQSTQNDDLSYESQTYTIDWHGRFSKL